MNTHRFTQSISQIRTTRGFTIVELIIVIVVIGIIAGIAIPQYNGVTERTRDTERKSDISSVSAQLEYYYGRHGAYPTLSHLNNTSFRTANNISVDDRAAILADPNNESVTTLSSTATPTNDTYGYVPLPSGCSSPTTTSGGQSGTSNPCRSYTLSARLEDFNDDEKDASLSTSTNAFYVKRNAAN